MGSTLLFLAYLAAQSLDITTTIVRVHEGCRENGLVKSAPAIVGFKIGGVITIASIRHPHPKMTLAPEIAGVASGIYGGVHNLGITCR